MTELKDFQEFISPLGLLIAGLIMRFYKGNEMFRGVDKYWFYFVLMGVLIIFLKYIR